MDHVLAIDQGTTGSRAIVYDRRGREVAAAYEEFPQYFPRPGWVEHDPEEIWRSVDRTIRKVLARVPGSSIAAIGVANQRETAVVWDRRTGRLAFGNTDAWVLWKLPGGRSHATDYTNASRTMLFDIDRLRWDDDLLYLFGIPGAILPEARPAPDVRRIGGHGPSGGGQRRRLFRPGFCRARRRLPRRPRRGLLERPGRDPAVLVPWPEVRALHERGARSEALPGLAGSRPENPGLSRGFSSRPHAPPRPRPGENPSR